MSSELRDVQIQVAALAALETIVTERLAETRAAAARVFADAKNEDGGGVSQLRVTLDGESLGLISIFDGPAEVVPDAAEIRKLADADPNAWERWVEPHTLQDSRVIDLIEEHFPELVQRRIRPGWLKRLLDRAVKKGGKITVTDPATRKRVIVQVAKVTHGPVTGKFRYAPEPWATDVILRAWRAGKLRPEISAGLGPLAIDPSPALTAGDAGPAEPIPVSISMVVDTLGHGGHGGWAHDPETSEVRCRCGEVLIPAGKGSAAGEAA